MVKAPATCTFKANNTASTVSQVFPGALVSVVPSAEPNSLPGYKDVVVASQMTGGAGLTGDVGQHVILSLNFQRAAGSRHPCRRRSGRTIRLGAAPLR